MKTIEEETNATLTDSVLYVLLAEDIGTVGTIIQGLLRQAAGEVVRKPRLEITWVLTSQDGVDAINQRVNGTGKPPFDLIILDGHLKDGTLGTDIARHAIAIKHPAVIVSNSAPGGGDDDLNPKFREILGDDPKLHWKKKYPSIEALTKLLADAYLGREIRAEIVSSNICYEGPILRTRGGSLPTLLAHGRSGGEEESTPGNALRRTRSK